MIHTDLTFKKLTSLSKIAKLGIISGLAAGIITGSYIVHAANKNDLINQNTPTAEHVDSTPQLPEDTNAITNSPQSATKLDEATTPELLTPPVDQANVPEVTPAPPTIDPAPVRPPMQGYQPSYPPTPQYDILLSHTSITMSSEAKSHTITARMNDGSSVHWLGGGRHDYLAVTPGHEESMPVKMIFEHAPGEMIRSEVRFHFVASYAARPATYGFFIFANDTARAFDLGKEIYVRVQ